MAVLKVFDIVYVTTNGNFETDVIANGMLNEMFRFEISASPPDSP